MILHKGTIIKTNYNTGPYVVKSVSGPCNCPRAIDTLGYNNGIMSKSSPDHYHIVCTDPIDRKQLSYLNGYNKVGDRILSVWNSDEILIVALPDHVQMTLF